MDTKLAEFAQKLGGRIVQLRKEHDFAQERLATLARMNKGYLSSVESGQRVPSLGMLIKLSKVLQVQVFELFQFAEAAAGKSRAARATGAKPAQTQARARTATPATGRKPAAKAAAAAVRRKAR